MLDPQSMPKYLVVVCADGDELRWQVRRAGDYTLLADRPSSSEQATALADALETGELNEDDYRWLPADWQPVVTEVPPIPHEGLEGCDQPYY